MILLATRVGPDEVQLPPLVIKKTLGEQIDDAWHELKYPNRSEFLRDVIAAGIPALRQKKETEGAPRS